MIDTGSLYLLAGLLLFGMGLYALIAYPNLIRKILGLNIMGVGVFMTFIAFGYRNATPTADPVTHALVITGIVVAVCATGLALTLAVRIHALTGKLHLTAEQED